MPFSPDLSTLPLRPPMSASSPLQCRSSRWRTYRTFCAHVSNHQSPFTLTTSFRPSISTNPRTLRRCYSALLPLVDKRMQRSPAAFPPHLVEPKTREDQSHRKVPAALQVQGRLRGNMEECGGPALRARRARQLRTLRPMLRLR